MQATCNKTQTQATCNNKLHFASSHTSCILHADARFPLEMRVVMEEQEAKQLLKKHGLRATSQRLAVLEILTASTRPLSYSEVLEQLDSDGCDPATVYRNLVKLEEVGLAQIVSRAEGMARYEMVLDSKAHQHTHPHFLCVDCGEVSCLPTSSVPMVEADERWSDSVKHAMVQLQGSCPDCLEQREQPPEASGK